MVNLVYVSQGVYLYYISRKFNKAEIGPYLEIVGQKDVQINVSEWLP